MDQGREYKNDGHGTKEREKRGRDVAHVQMFHKEREKRHSQAIQDEDVYGIEGIGNFSEPEQGGVLQHMAQPGPG